MLDKKKTLRKMLKKAILVAHETSIGGGVTGSEFQVVRKDPLGTSN
jgi:hypothetical protein